MTRAARRIAVPALAALALSAGACSSETHVQCPCAPSGFASEPLPASASSTPIIAVFTEPPCMAMDGGSGYITVSRQSAGTCPVRVQLATGDTYTFSIQFAETTAGCCGDFVYRVDGSAPMLVDAGVPD